MLLFYLSMLETEQEQKRFEDVYDGHKHTFLKAALRITRDEQDAEDAVHDAFMNLIGKKGKGHEKLSLPDDELIPLLISITKCRAYDIVRKKSRRPAESLDDMHDTPSTESPIDIQITTSEDFDRLLECLQQLQENHRGVLQLKYFSELSNEEIGSVLEVTTRQVETLVYRAKHKLREVYYSREGAGEYDGK